MGAYEVTVLDKVPPRQAVGHVGADVLDLEAVRQASTGQEAVIHLAGLDSGVAAPEHDYFETNVMGSWNVLAAAEEAGVRRVVVCSSIAAFGLEALHPNSTLDYLPFDEAHPLRPAVAYDLSKRVCEPVARSFALRGRLSVLCLRPAWIIFPNRVHEVDRHVRALDGDPDPARTPLPPHRAYVRPDDAARAFRLALESDDGGFDIVNIGAADTMSPLPTLAVIAREFRFQPPVRDPELFRAYPRAAAFSSAYARRRLGFAPTGDWDRFVRETPKEP
jgi:nucleoside-diphosphate-sugar epimerase